MQVFSINFYGFLKKSLQMKDFCNGFAFGEKLTIFLRDRLEKYNAYEIYCSANGYRDSAQQNPASVCPQNVFKQPINAVDHSAHNGSRKNGTKEVFDQIRFLRYAFSCGNEI